MQFKLNLKDIDWKIENQNKKYTLKLKYKDKVDKNLDVTVHNNYQIIDNINTTNKIGVQLQKFDNNQIKYINDTSYNLNYFIYKYNDKENDLCLFYYDNKSKKYINFKQSKSTTQSQFTYQYDDVNKCYKYLVRNTEPNNETALTIYLHNQNYNTEYNKTEQDSNKNNEITLKVVPNSNNIINCYSFIKHIKPEIIKQTQIFLVTTADNKVYNTNEQNSFRQFPLIFQDDKTTSEFKIGEIYYLSNKNEGSQITIIDQNTYNTPYDYNTTNKTFNKTPDVSQYDKKFYMSMKNNAINSETVFRKINSDICKNLNINYDKYKTWYYYKQDITCIICREQGFGTTGKIENLTQYNKDNSQIQYYQFKINIEKYNKHDDSKIQSYANTSDIETIKKQQISGYVVWCYDNNTIPTYNPLNNPDSPVTPGSTTVDPSSKPDSPVTPGSTTVDPSSKPGSTTTDQARAAINNQLLY